MHRNPALPMALALLGLAGCVSITPASTPARERAERPAFDAVSLSGLSLRDERIASRTEGSAFSYGSSYATGHVGDLWGSAAGSSFGSAFGSTRTYEAFDNSELQKRLRLALEGSGVARRVLPEAPLRIEGVFGGQPDTGVGRIIFNVLNTFPFFATFPYLGSTEATVQLRLYHNDELLRTWVGTGRSNWSKFLGFTPLPSISSELDQVRRRSMILAGHLAVDDAVGQIARDASAVASGLSQRGATHAVRQAPARQEKVPLLCEARWSDSRGKNVCQRKQYDAYKRLEPAITRLRSNSSTRQAQALRGCYARAQLAHGTDWEMVENCYLSIPVPASQ